MCRRNHRKIHNLYSYVKKEVTRIDKNGEEIAKNVSYILQFTVSARFMTSSLLNLVNKFFSERVHRIECKFGHDDKNVKLVNLNISVATAFMNL